jgi:hypothetical protein
METGAETTAGYIPTSRTSSYLVQNPEKRKKKKKKEKGDRNV